MAFVKEGQTLLHHLPCFTPAAVALVLHSMHLAINKIVRIQENVCVPHLQRKKCVFRVLLLAMETVVLPPKRMLHQKNLAAVQCAQVPHNQQAQLTRK